MLIFISYSNNDKELASDIKRAFEQIDDGIKCFIAHDDIPPGSEWEKEILSNLENADVFMPLQTKNLVQSAWCQQEVGYAIKRGIDVIPLKPTDSGVDPIGMYYKYQAAKIDTSNIVGSLKKLFLERELLTKPVALVQDSPKAKVRIGFTKKSGDGDLHLYSFELGVENLMSKSPENIMAEIRFPAEYIQKTDWNYDHLTGNFEVDPRIKKKILLLHFDYSGLSEPAKRTYSRFLLPGRTLWLFGKEPPNKMTNFEYYVNHENWENRHKYNVEWEIFFTSGELVAKGAYPFDKLQEF